MFEITLNGKTLYHPSSVECNITHAVIHEALNDAGYMEITIPYSNPMYNEIEERKGKIIVYKDNVERWFGEVRDISVDFSKNKSLYVVGEASYLNDTVQPQRIIKGTKFQILQDILNKHNAMCGTGKQFQIGAIGNNTKELEIVTDWEYTLDAIRNHLCDEEEYFRIRRVNGVRYIDIMPIDSYGKHSEQTIMFGDNLLDYAEQSSGEKIATICIPLGATLNEGGIEDYDNYLTCESANGGKNYVELPGAISRLGRITKVVHFNEFTDPKALVTAAVNYLQRSQYASLTLNLSAVDLSVLQADIDNYAVGDYIRAICEPFGMDAWFPVRERETDLLNLANNKISVGSEGTKSITTQNAETYDGILEIMPKKDNILKAALKNASALINSNGTDGCVSIRLDDKGKPYEILVMDADSIEQSTNVWRWNLKGFGHGKKKAGAKDFTWEANVAITMDGSIAGQFIAAGSISGAKISSKGIDTDNLADGAVGETQIEGGAVSTNKIAANAVTSEKIATDAIQSIGYEEGKDGYAKKGSFLDLKNGAMHSKQFQIDENGNAEFKGELKAASGTLSDKTGTLSLSGGDLNMTNNKTNGPGLFANGPGGLYSCWGAKNSAAKADGVYLEVQTLDILKIAQLAGYKSSLERLAEKADAILALV